MPKIEKHFMKIKRNKTQYCSVNYAKAWLDQLFLIPGLVWKPVSPLDVIIALCVKGGP